MQMQLLTAALSRLPEFQQLLTALEGGRCPAALSGVAAIHRAHIAAGRALKTGRPVVVVCADESEGERMARDLTALSGKPVPMLTPRSFTFHNAATVSRQWEQRRLAMLHGLSAGELTLAVAAVEGLMQRTMEPEVLEALTAGAAGVVAGAPAVRSLLSVLVAQATIPTIIRRHSRSAMIFFMVQVPFFISSFLL